ncbi:HmuY family protein [uncultured Duncaniella sp.]|uniref:HmuY family protein n=1 Tax=uncultured Duncaniella sp. TaxID=2768039 RepID=UPI0025FFC865|nr:HmuY family protein [uncultured Duncaniella sp.]
MATNFSTYLTAGVAAMLLSACNGILGNIYDEPAADAVSEYGFVTEATTTSPGSIYIDATNYTVWTYIDFKSMTTTALDVNAPAPGSWDIAIHRYDAKTNGGEVMETGATSFYSLANVVTPAGSDYISDIWTETTIVTDMSTMMNGYLSYAGSFYNPELSKWLNVDKSSMPPIYTPSNKVYVIRLSDGTLAGVRLANYMDALGVKGYMTIEYMYPLKL